MRRVLTLLAVTAISASLVPVAVAQDSVGTFDEETMSRCVGDDPGPVPRTH